MLFLSLKYLEYFFALQNVLESKTKKQNLHGKVIFKRTSELN